MHYTSFYQSPVGEILLASDDVGVVGIWFKGEKYYAYCLDKEYEPKETQSIREMKRWLDVYFQGKQPDFEPPIHMIGTAFQQEVWHILREIPYGTTTTYKEIARKIAQSKGIESMSAQAVGTAVGKNNLNLIVPCHRVVASNNSLAGYAGGIDKKITFLKLEGAFKDEYFVPKHSTAP
ncbi:methylated-DNA--[protein]-cysteine S-methyltransferase [Caviibacterium pharyngocola]|uniref:methylated-DNA--[protein]-cysteine S-methyltransferase n=1 Tax=Caviibacterium pharyngocola TaxID=28159 RepID=A0A2M8RUC0_9PAST|nr:methylated-DNA--[protein]-cysteine S-methyltransferase [Caviibacterium pharyngocola]PJG82492.1 6-O-methylguanine DNA methyltransferase [Caviibacterium pharyngocola]